MKLSLLLCHILLASAEDNGTGVPIPTEVARIEHANADRAGETTEELATEDEPEVVVSPEHSQAPMSPVGEVTPLTNVTEEAIEEQSAA